MKVRTESLGLCSDITLCPVNVTRLGVIVDITGVPERSLCCLDLSGSTVADLDTVSCSPILDVIFLTFVSIPELILIGGEPGCIGGGRKERSATSSSSEF